MAIDKDLLDQARSAFSEVATAERALQAAQAEYHRRIRRLHVAGSPLRDIAAALQLSHQRVHQIIENGGAKRRWKRPRILGRALACSFCARPDTQVQKLVAGPDVFICDACIQGTDRFDAVHPASTLHCSFCGKPRKRVSGMFAGPENQVCLECLGLCKEIISRS